MKSYWNLILFLFLFQVLAGAPLVQEDSVAASGEEEEVYLSFRYKGVIDEIVVAYYKNGEFYFPLTEIFDYCYINYNLDATSLSIYGYFLNEGNPYLIELSSRKATIKNKEVNFTANDYLVKELDYYITAELLKSIFELDLQINLSRLSLRLVSPNELPVITRYTRRYREQLRQQYEKQASEEDYELLLDREYRMLDGALMDYSVYSSISETNKSANLNLSLGGEVLFGDVQGSLFSEISQDTGRFGASDIRWRYSNNSHPSYSTITLGQQSSDGLISKTFQGVKVTNEPLIPKRSYDSYVIDGDTEAEAEVELYQDNRLVEVTQSDGSGYYRFVVPLNYGNSNFKIRIYGKQGTTLESDRNVLIPFNFLPVGEVRYELAAGRIADEFVNWKDQLNVTQGNIAIGVNNWLTTGLGMEYIEDNNNNEPVLYAKVSSRVAGDILLGLDAAFANYYHFSMRGFGPNNTNMSMDYSYFVKQNQYNSQNYKHFLTGSMFYPFEVAKIKFTGRGSGTWINQTGENQFKLTADIHQYYRGIRIRYGIRENRIIGVTEQSSSNELQLGAVYTLPRISSIHKLLRGSYFRTDLSYNTSVGNFEDLRLQYIKQFSNRLKAQVLTSFDLHQNTTYFEVGVSWDFDALRSTSTTRIIRSSPSFIQTLRGSVGLDRENGEYLWDNRQQVGRAGVSVRMFVDENYSGSYDDGEEILPGNAITIEKSSSRQIIKSGITRLTQLQPYRRYNFRVNEARIQNPLLVASKKNFSVVTDPNRYKRVDVPFFMTGVIDGRVDRLKEETYLPMAGLRIHIKSENSGYEATVRTFGDGSFYSMEIPPGDYEVWIDDSQLEFLRMRATPEKLTFTVEASQEGEFVEGLNFVIE
ncbi:MAG: hypothetical protein K9N35_10230 [Candidatus Marinimicrobia bacterium]|nr:hypothetical protein [Candidatus Neomarinimicrobiota bacterium]